MKVAIVGLGLIGGSVALELKKSQFASTVIGVEGKPEHAAEAISLGLVDRVQTLAEACVDAELVILAVPVSAILNLLPKTLDLISDQTVVTDMGSTKASLVEAVQAHKHRANYVPSHPMAGTEFSGPTAAHLGLFYGKAAVICDETQSSPQALALVRALYEALQMRLISMPSKAHDLHAAYVSHLSHISSFVLANTVLDKEKDADAIFNLASGGFESTVRLAKSSPEMWTPIFEQNQTYITEALGAYIERLKWFHESLLNQKFSETKKYMEHANQIKRVLQDINERSNHAKK